MHVLLAGFCRLFCQGRGWEQKDQQNDCCVSKDIGAGEESWLVPGFF